MSRILHRQWNDYISPWQPITDFGSPQLFGGELLFDWQFDQDLDVDLAEEVPQRVHQVLGIPDGTWYQFNSPRSIIFLFGKLGCCISSSSRLRGGGKNLAPELFQLFQEIAPYTNNAHHMSRRFRLGDLTAALKMLGVTSSQGRVLSDSQVSNCIRKTVLCIGPAYSKPRYKGKNFKSYPHTYQPRQLSFMTLFQRTPPPPTP